jgi:uncharacterized membrane protein YhhN
MLAGPMAAAVALLLAAEYRGWRAGIWLAKPVASTLFVLAAWTCGALDSRYGRAVLAALSLSWLGDVLLIPKHRPRVFQAGVAAFGLAHVAYVAAFLSRGLEPTRMAFAAPPAALALVVAGRWLRPHVPAELRVSVYAYMGILSAMLVAAAGASSADARICVGAGLFYLSDLYVARDRFVAPGFENGLIGLPLYYAAQLVLAYSVGVSSPN